MQTVKTTLIVLICSALIGACGLKGPLYLPQEDPTPVNNPGPESPSGNDPEDKEEDDEDNGGRITIST